MLTRRGVSRPWNRQSLHSAFRWKECPSLQGWLHGNAGNASGLTVGFVWSHVAPANKQNKHWDSSIPPLFDYPLKIDLRLHLEWPGLAYSSTSSTCVVPIRAYIFVDSFYQISPKTSPLLVCQCMMLLKILCKTRESPWAKLSKSSFYQT